MEPQGVGQPNAISAEKTCTTEDVPTTSQPELELFAPKPSWCGFRGNCMRLPHSVRDLGEYIGSCINSALRRSKLSRKNGEDGDNLEQLSLWALRLKSHADADSQCEYFMVAHILHSPIRIILVPLTPLRSPNPSWMALEFSTVQEGSGLDQLLFRLLYDHVNIITGKADFDWEAGSMCLLGLPIVPCQWQTVVVQFDALGGLTGAKVLPQTQNQCPKLIGQNNKKHNDRRLGAARRQS